MREPYEILVKPLVSEKSMMMMGENKYSFAVAKDANKIEIKNAVEKLFNVTVLSVNTRTIQGKIKRQGRYEGKRPDVKKAIVTLKAGDQIKVFEGLA
ncbi:MAG: 50S ribosomal protein L23 [Clostridia bacterium]